jgi:hypothetical protein
VIAGGADAIELLEPETFHCRHRGNFVILALEVGTP